MLGSPLVVGTNYNLSLHYGDAMAGREISAARLVALITDFGNQDWYVGAMKGVIKSIAPEVDIVEYRLIVDGLVDTPLTLTYEEVMEYPTVTEVVRLFCPDWFIDYAEWTGVPVSTLLAESSVKPEASQVVFHALDGYRATLLIEEVQGDGVFLAHTVNGEILPAAHGYPLRLVVRDSDGNKWVKWLERIEVK